MADVDIVSLSGVTLSNRKISENGYKLSLQVDSELAIKPGQFAHLRVDEGCVDPLLRRPLSIWDASVRNGKTIVDFVYAVVGRGTELLSMKQRGDVVGFLGPLGNWFTGEDGRQRYIFVAGGVGIVPFYIFARTLLQQNSLADISLFFGARSKGFLHGLKDLQKLGIKIETATEDGSMGRRGYVTELLLEDIDPQALYYACGPDRMLEAVAGIAKEKNLRCELSLERRMGCALGACRACVTKVVDDGGWRYSRICCEGTVYSANQLL